MSELEEIQCSCCKKEAKKCIQVTTVYCEECFKKIYEESNKPKIRKPMNSQLKMGLIGASLFIAGIIIVVVLTNLGLKPS